MFDKHGTGQRGIDELRSMNRSFKKQQSSARQEPALKG
jgi:hypothetical protein